MVVTSDHGEGLGEHGEDVHGYFVYESTLRVPLVFRGPGVTPGTRIDTLTRSVDLFPTLLELAGIRAGAPDRRPGRSLAAALRGERIDDEPSFAESLVPLVHYGWSDLRTVRDGRWKYILAPRPELYDLERDPAETQQPGGPGAGARPRAARRARRTAAARAARGASRRGARRRCRPTCSRSSARSATSAPADPRRTKASGADPKDKLEEYKTLNTLMRRGLDRASRRAAGGDAGAPRRPRRAAASTASRCTTTAAAPSPRSGGGVTPSPPTRGRSRSCPPTAPAWRALAESRVALRDLRGAAAAYEKLLAMAPRDALARVQLGEVYRDLGRADDAARLMQAAVEIDPAPASYWNSLGMVLGGAGRMAEAEHAFAEAASRDADDAQYVYNRGLALQRLGRRGEAIAQFQRAADSGFPPARKRLAEISGWPPVTKRACMVPQSRRFWSRRRRC